MSTIVVVADSYEEAKSIADKHFNDKLPEKWCVVWEPLNPE